MPALSKHRGGEEDTERPECVRSLAIQTDLKPTGSGALSPKLCYCHRPSRSSPPPHPGIYSFVNLSHCVFLSLSLPLFCPVFHIHLTAMVFLSGKWERKVLRNAQTV